MSVPLSYITVILIWTTTPLAIKWSSEGTGFMFAVASRMVLGAILAVLVATILRYRLSWDRKSVVVYLYSGCGFATSMIFVYWGAQYIPSGWVSLIFGTSPIITGVLGFLMFRINDFSRSRLAGLMLALAGLTVVFTTGLDLSEKVGTGILAVLTSTVIYSYTALKVKQHNNGLPAISITTGGLLVAVPFYGVSWYLVDGTLPAEVSTKAGSSIVYLAVFGSVIGFALFFYILKNVSASQVSLITLVTPVSALLLGNYLNNEPVTIQVISGAVMILAGLATYEFGWVLRRDELTLE